MEKQGPPKTSSFKFSQIFGYKGPHQPVQQEDIITCLKFDSEGKHIALGDRAGRIIIFQQADPNPKNTYQLDYFAQYQSHFREFDPLRSMDIDEAIVDINWLKTQGKYMKMVTTNTHNIKMWKIFEKFQKKMVKNSGKELSMPILQNTEANYTAELQKDFPCKHANPIKEISTASHEQYLLSTDEAQTFLWDMERPQKPFIVCDTNDSSSKNQENKQSISCCKMHPKNDSLFLLGMNKGSLRLGDLRVSSKIDSNTTCFKYSSPTQKNYLINLISNISSATFTQNCKYIISRDYLTVKIWDVCNTKKPVNCVMLQQGLKSKLCEMVENEAIFDQFKVSVSSDNGSIVTGSYNNVFHVLDFQGSNSQYQLNNKKATICKSTPRVSPSSLLKMDYDRKVLANDYNPNRNIAAVASLNCFYTYTLSS